MSTIGRNWNGHVFGTNTGNAALTLDGDDQSLKGLVRLSDNQSGVIVYEVGGSFEDGALRLEGKPQGEPPEGLIFGELTVAGELTPEGRIDGEWSTTIGTGGTFQLWPHNYRVRPANIGAVPEQLNTSTRTLGAVRLYADDVRNLIAQLTKDFSQKRALITFNEKGSEKTMYSDDFEGVLDNLSELRELKIFVSEPELYGLNRNASVELSAKGENIVRVQSVHEAWAVGKAETIFLHAQGYQRKLATQFRKFGLSVNAIITLAALAALPGLPTFGQRVAFGASALFIQLLIAYLHTQYVPNFVLFPSEKKSTFFGRFGPGLFSWTITTVGAVVAAIIYGLLKGELVDSPLLKLLH